MQLSLSRCHPQKKIKFFWLRIFFFLYLFADVPSVRYSWISPINIVLSFVLRVASMGSSSKPHRFKKHQPSLAGVRPPTGKFSQIKKVYVIFNCHLHPIFWPSGVPEFQSPCGLALSQKKGANQSECPYFPGLIAMMHFTVLESRDPAAIVLGPRRQCNPPQALRAA